ncbi:hypothetical protein C5Y96_18910 [Blastopirellula marina]|uniref:Uncharacterized protein n=1 Tax=Blastopirellula marina TaxID=124 RepID=A0A2S8F610_9BACT|nr:MULTISPECIES: hypothetical protein [Pirellulaceae]PQO27599.1 hypothetical protein C5Y96_18910 [Blastopirellula marina]RCS48136.1 hypothetical protein DTL36_18935 [Bremerella cremea]
MTNSYWPNSIPSPSIGIDLDGTIDEAPTFFRLLSHRWPGRVFIITFRDDRTKAEQRLAEFGIRYDELVLVTSLEAKADVIHRLGILIYFDDQDEAIQHVPHQVNVFKIRNGGNFDFDVNRWLYSDRTGRQV